MITSKRLIFTITGGLGNQLFQIAAALNFAGAEEVNVEWCLAKPRLNSAGRPEIDSFSLPEQIKLLPKRRGSWLVSKSSGYVLRMGLSPKGFETSILINSFIRKIAGLISSIYFRSKRKTVNAIGLGFCEISLPKGKLHFNGYFQSYRWASKPEIQKKLRELKIKEEGFELKKYIDLAVSESPLIIHIRLGDYKEEDDFGILPVNYYLEAFSKIDDKRYKEIWLFSDEPEAAIEILPLDIREKCRVIPEIDGSAASTLELMRYGKAYVIGNSTFSWWGAFLSYTQNPQVIAPDPWFKIISDPIDLIPPTWSRVRAWK
jgi:hypothetical protein